MLKRYTVSHLLVTLISHLATSKVEIILASKVFAEPLIVYLSGFPGNPTTRKFYKL